MEHLLIGWETGRVPGHRLWKSSSMAVAAGSCHAGRLLRASLPSDTARAPPAFDSAAVFTIMRAPMSRFEPIHDAHAIEQVALAVLVAKPLADSDLTAAFGLAEQFRSELPITQQLQLQTIAIGLIGLPPGGPSAGAFGRQYTSTRN